MPMNINVARVRISRELGEAEIALNAALLKQSELFTSLLTARRDATDRQFEGQETLVRLSRSQQSLLSAGSDLARVHGRLLEINREMGGTASDCPDDWRAPMHGMDDVAA